MVKKTWVPFIAICFLLGSWEFCSRFFSDLLFVLPPPSRILLCIWQKSDRLLFHTGITLKEMAGGFILALLVAFPLAWMMAFWESMRMILQPLFIVIQCIPMFALAPLMVMWFGWSYTAIVLPTALMIFFPLTMNIYQGLLSTPQHLTDYFKTLNATPWQFFFKLQLPASLPHIFAGFRISAAIAGIAAIAGEWAGGQNGLGMLMLQSRRETDLEITFGALFCLTFISSILYLGMAALEKAVKNRKPWRLPFNSLAATALVTIVFGCQPSPKIKETRLLLDWVPNPNHVALYVGIEKNFFKQRGIDLQILKLHDPSDSLSYLMSGQADLAVYYMVETLQAVQKGAKIAMIGALIEEPLNSLLYRKDDGIRTIEDLNDKIIGYSMDGKSFKSLQSLLKQKKLTPKAMHNVSFDLVSTLATKRVDAVYDAYWNIEVPHLRSLGIETEFFKMSDLGIPPHQELVMIAKEDFIQASSEFVKKFQAAMQEAITYCQQNPKEAFEMYLKANPDKGDKAREWEREAWELTYPILAKSQQIDQAAVNNYRDWLLERAILQR
ncbi:ABC transporter permease/substrate-binding protein [Parachlamydia acanthamoebae]|jgi:NitT/TauT family transport system substrate-binding protein|uniref:ABC transporter permease/substrate-binding protein n=1 Tax=Parachlamydia acanthamoebae TaxID=83552 RepID=UPI0024E1E506|nr:ABC transporter permease/substrate-binding protein [Parachlamydia acanthamoebae]